MSFDKPRDGDEGGRRLTTDTAMARLGVLDQAARDGHRMRTEVTSVDGGQNYYVRLDRPGRAPARVFCAPRAEEAGRLWFYGDGGAWIAEASGGAGVTAALAWLKDKAAEQAGGQAAERVRM
ncbi:hypothetical protein [Actinomadura rayongensis]|uniref:Uncharacterized protein n=1 Tax=Actinomadura rayongensis TaxID=1429076 RepID=A0A6I4W627_9ACTN|nr:hypothetical protein [Actinomadura rayongensis]MXQ64931.1 hypothetical protein [Actinomadura rayongensis]